ncbi:hypothetical protein [Bacillus pumilus]|uniref:hypothetical protein n=1 Tax=Bacillus pumilus TaxID=1408 RepID=UPI002ABE7F11|nr:hypothetical protein [Bacillus pumilus]
MFQETIDKIKNALNDINGIILGDDYDAVLTKPLASTNLISENSEAGSKQSHIALSGKDSRDFFPYVNIFHYTDETINDQKMKSFYVLQVPMILSEKNITKVNNNKANFDFLNGKVIGKPSVKLSRPGNSPQIELGNTTTSDDIFYKFRSLFYVNDVLVILKKRQKLEYEAYIIKKDDAVSYNFDDSVLFSPNRLKATIVDLDEVTPKDVRHGEEEINYKTGIKSEFHHNRIIFGAPGTGKSYELNQDKDTLLKDGGVYERVTFHPDYSYANFVGTYKPTMLEPVSDLIASEDEKRVLSVLLDDKTAQEKYDLLYDRFKDGDLTCLSLLIGLYDGEKFKTKKKDGSDASDDNSVERNHGRAIRPYVNLISNKKSASEIAYEYVPGPFMRTYVKALKNAQSDNPKPYLLIVEEINRANVAAVFGDVFQLLDRDGDNVSEYDIQASEDIKKYLAKELGGKPQDYSKIRIPDNMFIWATMNNADQGVFPMDTAFKRRWNFDYLGINHNENDIKDNLVAVGSWSYRKVIEWNELRKAINNTLSSYKINEDKLLGPYFLSRKIVVPNEGNEVNANLFNSAFKSKVLMYLFDDAAKQKRASLFDGCKDTMKYSSICEEFDKRGVEIFCKEIRDMFPKAIAIVAESAEEYK